MDNEGGRDRAENAAALSLLLLAGNSVTGPLYPGSSVGFSLLLLAPLFVRADTENMEAGELKELPLGFIFAMVEALERESRARGDPAGLFV